MRLISRWGNLGPGFIISYCTQGSIHGRAQRAKQEASLQGFQILGPGCLEWRRGGEGMEGMPSSSLPGEAPMVRPGVPHMLKGSLVNMEGDQGGRGC